MDRPEIRAPSRFRQARGFGAAHPDWAADAWIRYRQEGALYGERAHPAAVTPRSSQAPRLARRPENWPWRASPAIRGSSRTGGGVRARRLAQRRPRRLDGRRAARRIRRRADPCGSQISHGAAALRRKPDRAGFARRGGWLARTNSLLAKVWANAIRGPVPEAALDAIPGFAEERSRIALSARSIAAPRRPRPSKRRFCCSRAPRAAPCRSTATAGGTSGE